MMKRPAFLVTLAVFSAVAFLGTGCKKRPVGVTALQASRVGQPPQAGALGPTHLNQPQEPVVPPGPPSNENSSTSTRNLPTSASMTNKPNAEANLQSFEGMLMDTNTLADDTAHFDFDSSVVKPQDYSKVNNVGDVLKQRPETKLLIAGNCDERGTEEYNRALGERRALSLRAYLIKYGIAADRIRTISYGEDRPVDPAHNEIAWAKNRRGDFTLLLPKNSTAGAQ